MDEKSVIIIGGGIAGLSAGCYARLNHYHTQIFEQDTRPGGLNTSWERGQYTINGGLAFLMGSGPGVGFYRIWEELGVVPKIRMIDYEHLLIVEGKEGQKFYMYNDLDRLEEHMKELAPEDKGLIEDFIGGARIFTRYDMPIDKAPELLGFGDKMKLMVTKFPLIRAIGKWKKVALRDFSARFKNPFLREALFQARGLFSEDVPVLLFQMALAMGHMKSAGFPEGGAFKLSKSIEHYFKDLGGKINYRSRVEKILVENNRAAGVRLEDGSEHRADTVISAADGRTTIFEMLDGKYVDAKILGYFDRLPVGPSPLLVAFGVNRTFEDIPHTALGTIFPLDKPVAIPGKKIEWLRPMIYNFDASFAPAEKTLLRVVCDSDYEYWKALRENPNDYRAEKEKVASSVISALEERFPGFSSQVEMWDVATPLTLERYTGNWKGSALGWNCTVDTFFMPMGKTLPGLDGFYMAGQWVEPGGGVPMAAVSGRNVIQLICKRDKKPFVTRLPI
ncbi:MAG: NAD(P)/FAD-dependent oxidoreductase [Deltaproteobacteria bacterium]|nr:NAD(P)/FAD-dependent oxidoreductase [Deltaproteobacteria bacterium]